MKKANQLFLVSILIFLNACQGRNMPLPKHDYLQIATTPASKIKHKVIPLEDVKIAYRPKKVQKYLKTNIRKKNTTITHKTKKINIPLLSPKNKKNTTLPPLPMLSSIEKKNKTSLRHLDNSDKIIKNIPLSSKSFSGGAMVNNLDMGEIRIGNTPDYTSIIFDSYNYINQHTLSTQKAPVSGTYLFTYIPNKNIIIGFLDGYKDFSALKENQHSLFKNSSIVENIYVVKHLSNDGIKFIIKLRKKVKIKIYDVKNPGRILVNLFPL